MSDVPPGTPPTPPGGTPPPPPGHPPTAPSAPPTAPPPGAAPPPTGAPPQYGQPQYGQPQYGQPQYGQPEYGQPSFGAPPPPGYQPYSAPAGGYGPGGTPAGQFGEIASFGVRLGGWLLDSLLYGLLALVFAIPGGILIFNDIDTNCVSVGDELFCNDDFGGGIFGGLALIGVGILVIAFIYLRALAKSGQTWGRKIVGIKVIKELDGTPPGWGKALGRQLFASFISAQIIYIGYLWMLWDDKKQTLHDKVAGTHVIRT